MDGPQRNIVLTLHHPLDPQAGAAGAVLNVAHALRQLGQNVEILSHDNMLPVAKGNFATIGFPLWCAARLKQLAPQTDVIDASTGDAWLYGFTSSHSRRPLLVTHSHGLEHVLHETLLAQVRTGKDQVSWKYPFYNGGWRLWEVQRSLRCADLCLFLNDFDREYAIDKLGLDTHKARAVPNGIDGALLAEDPVFGPPPKNGAVRIVQIGSFIPRKGITYAVPALNSFLVNRPGSTVEFLGPGCGKQKILDQFETRVREQVRVVERFHRSQLGAFLKGAHILLFPSLSEGFPLALGEAMACGLAPVASRIPGVVEMVKHGQSGVLIPPADPQAIHEALRELSQDIPRLQSLRQGARTRAIEYPWSRIAAERLDLYEEFLARKRKSGAR